MVVPTSRIVNYLVPRLVDFDMGKKLLPVMRERVGAGCRDGLVLIKLFGNIVTPPCKEGTVLVEEVGFLATTKGDAEGVETKAEG